MTARFTVADIRAAKGKRQFTMVRTVTSDQLEAAERAGVDMVSVTPEMIVDPKFRSVAPRAFAVPGVDFCPNERITKQNLRGLQHLPVSF